MAYNKTKLSLQAFKKEVHFSSSQANGLLQLEEKVIKLVNNNWCEMYVFVYL